jgi:hypothetical protein
VAALITKAEKKTDRVASDGTGLNVWSDIYWNIKSYLLWWWCNRTSHKWEITTDAENGHDQMSCVRCGYDQSVWW